MSSQTLLPLIRQTMQAFGYHYQEAIRPVMREVGFQGGDWLRTFYAYGCDPEPLTIDLIHKQLRPFNSIHSSREAFAQTAERGFLQAIDEDSYRLTAAGREGMEKFYQVTSSAIANLAPLSDSDMNRLADWLHKIIAATIASDAPQDKTQLLMSRRSDPGTATAVAIRIDQYLTDLIRFYADAYNAAWQVHDIPGFVWEAFSDIWQNDGATSAAAIAENRSSRGFSVEEYAAALDQLVARDWLTKEGDQYAITPTGQQLRDETEATTHRYFTVGCTALSNSEQTELEDLLQKASDALRREALKQIWLLANGALGNVAPLYTDKTGAVMAEYGLNKPGHFFVLWQGLTLEPHPVSSSNLRRRFPYMNPRVYEERLASAAADGLLAASDVAGEYTVTAKGREAYAAVDNVFTAELEQMELLSESRLERLVGLIGGIAERSAEMENGVDKSSLLNNRKLRRGDDVSPLVKLDEFLDDLNAFRDDVHLTAVAPHNLSGPAIEAHTFLWRGDATTGAALAERLPFRGNDAARYTAALQELVHKGWATETNGTFALTVEGTAVREAIEQKTDDLFYAAWEDLSSVDIQRLISLLNRLHRHMKDLVADKMAADRKDLWPLMVEVGLGIFQQVGEQIKSVPEELGLNRPFATLGLLVAKGTSSVSTAKLHHRSPYAHTHVIDKALHDLAKDGQLRPGENGTSGTYSLTDKGQKTVQSYLDSFWGAAASLAPLPDDELAKIADLMGRIVAACAAVDDLDTANLQAMLGVAVADDAAAMIQIDHYLDSLNAFRDDAHIAAFRPHQVSGQAWEAFTLIWQGKADTAVALAEKLKSRGFTEADYAKAVDSLVQKGWVMEADGRYALTEEGTNIRQQAEALTDRVFYAPWTTLNQQETTELRDLLSKLANNLKEPALA